MIANRHLRFLGEGDAATYARLPDRAFDVSQREPRPNSTTKQASRFRGCWNYLVLREK
jgi:hypothetical protein